MRPPWFGFPCSELGLHPLTPGGAPSRVAAGNRDGGAWKPPPPTAVVPLLCLFLLGRFRFPQYQRGALVRAELQEEAVEVVHMADVLAAEEVMDH